MSEIKLVLDGADTPQVPAVPENNKPVVTAEQVLSQVEQLSPEEKAQVEAFAERIDLHKPEIVTNYGATVQKQSAAIATRFPAAARAASCFSRYRSSLSHLGQVPLQSPLNLHACVT